MFPNLREIIFPRSDFRYQPTEYLDGPFQFTQSTSKLEKIQESDECELTRQLAMSNMCSKLKILELSFTNQPDSISSLVLSQLKNMPVLETLLLCEFIVKIRDLEMLHHNIPSIKSLYFREVVISPDDIPHDVMPATLITKLDLQLDGTKDLDTHIQFYKYLTRKYPSVGNPSFNDYGTSYRDIISRRKLYNEGILPFYQNIGSRIDTFVFQAYCDGLDAFRKFDDYGMKLKELTIEDSNNDSLFPLEELVQSQQSKSIRKLILKDIIPAHLDMMANMEALTYLEINCAKEYEPDGERFMSTINFGQLINACPETLTYLSICGVELTCDESTTNITSIQCLKLEDVKIKSTIRGTSFPELSELHLSPIIEDDGLTISLPNNHLKEAKIHVLHEKNGYCDLVVTMMNEGKPHCTVIGPTNRRGISGMLYCDDVPAFVSAPGKIVHFTCASAKKLSYSIDEEHDSPVEDYF